MIEAVKLTVDEETKAIVQSLVDSISETVREAINDAIGDALDDTSSSGLDEVASQLQGLRESTTDLARAEALEDLDHRIESSIRSMVVGQASTSQAVEALATDTADIRTTLDTLDSHLGNQDKTLASLADQRAAGAKEAMKLAAKLDSVDQSVQSRASAEAIEILRDEMDKVSQFVQTRAATTDTSSLATTLNQHGERLAALAEADVLADTVRTLTSIRSEMAEMDALKEAREHLSGRVGAIESRLAAEMAAASKDHQSAVEPLRQSLSELKDSVANQDRQLAEHAKAMTEVLDLLRKQQERIEAQQTALVKLSRPWYRRIFGG